MQNSKEPKAHLTAVDNGGTATWCKKVKQAGNNGPSWTAKVVQL